LNKFEFQEQQYHHFACCGGCGVELSSQSKHDPIIAFILTAARSLMLVFQRSNYRGAMCFLFRQP
jgi:hypothetical protein